MLTITHFFIANCFHGLSFSLSARSLTLLMLAGDDVCITVSLACYQSNDTAAHFIFLFKSLTPSISDCLSIVQKHLAQTCASITPADSQTFHQLCVFDGKTHNLETRIYDVSMMSLIAENIYLFHQWNTYFLLSML